MNYSDFELLEYLKENHYAASFENLCILKEGLESGSIVLEAKKEEPEEKENVEKEIVEEKPETEEVVDAAAPRVSIVMPVDGSMQISNAGKQVAADTQGNVSVSLTEKNINYLLKSYLVEDCEMSESDYSLLTEDAKIDSVKELAMTLFKSVEEKMAEIDTSVADRSRGSIKSLDILPALQDTLTQLEAMAERNENGSQYVKAINTIVKSILYLNQYSSTFKEAYRNKKTIMILRYQSVILSIISSISYIISTVIDYSGNTVKFNNSNTDIMNFAPMITLSQFVSSVDSGEFKTILRDVTVMREFYLEIPVETMSTVLEASGFADSVISGVKNLYDALSSNNDKLVSLLYKAAGVIIILLSLRDTFYTLYNMKTKVSDMITGIQNFAGLNNGGNVLSKLTQFASKFRTDAEYSSDLGKREVESENKKFGNHVRAIQNSSKIEIPETESNTKIASPFKQQPFVDNNDDFVFDF